MPAHVFSILRACPTASLITTTDGIVSFANASAEELFARDEPLAGQSVRELLPTWSSTQTQVRSEYVDGQYRRIPCDIHQTPAPGRQTILFILSRPSPVAAEAAVTDFDLPLRQVIEMLPHPMCVFDAEDRYVLWNEKYTEVYPNVARHLRRGIKFGDILRLSLNGNDMPEVAGDKDEWLRQRMDQFRLPSSQIEYRMKDGRWLRHDDRRMPDGGAIGLRIDITELKQREEWLQQLFDANPMPMMLCDGSSLEILQVNEAACQFYECSPTALVSRKACSMHEGREAEEFRAMLRALSEDYRLKTVWRQRTATGGFRDVLIYVKVLREFSKHRLLLTIADVSENVRAEKEATHKATHDQLTGLLNRGGFQEELHRTLINEAEQDVYVHCLDLDGFKPVNDTFGHAAGDDVLALVGHRLSWEAGEHAVARLGGDEFAIIQCGNCDEARHLVERCLAALRQPFPIRGMSVQIGVSIGVSGTIEDGLRDGSALMQRADRALYAAKAAGRNTWRMSVVDAPSKKAAHG